MDAELSDSRPIFGSKSLFFGGNHTLTKKVMGGIFQPFAFLRTGAPYPTGPKNLFQNHAGKK